ncbi:MAG: SIR2 family protein [Flavobacteriaceae bacterium]
MSEEKKRLFTKKRSKENLEFLAKQLALNHYYSSTVDLFGLKSDEEIRETSKELIKKGFDLNDTTDRGFIFKNKSKDILKLEGNDLNDPSGEKQKNGFDMPGVTRNILVVGAGCSFNSFRNIPLAPETVKLLKKGITVVSIKKKEKDKEYVEISLDYLSEFSKSFNPDIHPNEYNIKECKCETSTTFLHNQFKLESYSLIKEISDKYHSGIQKWELTQSYIGGEKNIDFESFLNIIGQILSVKTVRKTMQDIYSFSEGTTLFYSIVAHLFKNRFIDVIINFNFDELLDRAIDDELGANGYKKILSDGDCSAINKISKGGRLRQPLYIKPHGTASHKSTLRFTKDQYHELPNDMRSFLSNLISGKEEKELKNKPRPVNLITVGFEMNSIEFNEILIKNLPKNSSFFDVLWHNPKKNAKSSEKLNYKVEQKHLQVQNLFSGNMDKMPSLYPIAHMLYEQGCETLHANKEKQIHFNKYDCSLGGFSRLLFANIHEFFNDTFKPRGIDKHFLINALFGNRLFWNHVTSKSPYNEIIDNDELPSESLSYYSKKYFESSDYYKDRVIIEALINLTVNVGKIDLYILMQGIAGYYYSKYLDSIRKENEENKKNKKIKSILDLVSGFNFIKGDNPDSLGIRYLKISEDYTDDKKVFDDLFENFLRGNNDYQLNFSDIFKKYLKDIDNNHKILRNLLEVSFNNIRLGDNSKIYSNFNDLGNHIFKNHSHLDIINTNLANKLHFINSLTEKESQEVNTICMVADNGYQIANFLPELYYLYSQRKKFKVFLIIQDHFNGEKSYYYQRKKIIKMLSRKNDLYKDFLSSDFFNLLILPIVDHNRHMTIFMKCEEANQEGKKQLIDQKENVLQAIYYYKKGLSQKINPIHLKNEVNLGYLLQMFENYSRKAVDYLKKIHIINDNDINHLKNRKINTINENEKWNLPKVLSEEFIIKNWVFDPIKKSKSTPNELSFDLQNYSLNGKLFNLIKE